MCSRSVNCSRWIRPACNQSSYGCPAASPDFAVNLPAPVGTGSGGALGLMLGSIGGAFNLNLRLSALVDYQTGMTYEEGSIEANHQNFQNTAMSNPVSGPVDPVFAVSETKTNSEWSSV